MQYPQLKEIQRRPKQYWNADGLPDLMMGSIWTLWSLAFLLPELLPQSKWLSHYWDLALPLLILSGFAATWATKKLKQRLTFPRTGYVEWRPPRIATRILWVFLGGAMAAATIPLVLNRKVQSATDLAGPAVALLMAIAFVIAAAWHKMPHLLFLSALSLVLAGVLIRIHLGLDHSLILLYLSLGVLWCVIGGIRLWAYMRRNPRPQEDGA